MSSDTPKNPERRQARPNSPRMERQRVKTTGEKRIRILLILAFGAFLAGILLGILISVVPNRKKADAESTGISYDTKTAQESLTEDIRTDQELPDTDSENTENTGDEQPTGESGEVAQTDPVTLTVTVVGDCTLGTDESFDYSTSLNQYYDDYGKEYFLDNVRDIFEADDLTIANFEGTLTTSTDRTENLFAFKAPAEFATILSCSSVEAVNTANNHSHDFGEQGYTDTMAALEAENIVHFGYDETAVVDVKGVKVGLVGIYEVMQLLGCETQLKEDIAKVKADGADLIIVIFHWGNELDIEPDIYQLTLAREAVDEGADLVCGHHAHVIQGIETYKGKTIAYGLANFCFGGNVYPREMDTIIFQQTFTVGPDGVTQEEPNIIPCSVSSASGYNNYQPTPATGDEATRILEKLRERTTYIPAAS